MKALLFLVLISALSLTSCASMQQAWVDQNCQREAAYEKGMNDARSGAPMNSQYVASCPVEGHDVILAGYNEGYNSGLGSVQQTTTTGAPPAFINVNIGGTPAGSINPRAWYCKIKAFTEEFEAFAPTQLEAVHQVTAQCRVKYDPMFCKESSCRLNQ
jgi:hypothetical protein